MKRHLTFKVPLGTCLHPLRLIMSSLFAHNLPSEVLENILRFISLYPTLEHTQDSVSVHDALALLNDRDPLQAVARNNFRIVSMLSNDWWWRTHLIGSQGVVVHDENLFVELSLDAMWRINLFRIASICEVIGDGLLRLSIKVLDDSCDDGSIQAALRRIKVACPRVAVYLSGSATENPWLTSPLQALGDSLVGGHYDTDLKPLERHFRKRSVLYAGLRSATLSLNACDVNRFLEFLLPHVGRRLHELCLIMRNK